MKICCFVVSFVVFSCQTKGSNDEQCRGYKKGYYPQYEDSSLSLEKSKALELCRFSGDFAVDKCKRVCQKIVFIKGLIDGESKKTIFKQVPAIKDEKSGSCSSLIADKLDVLALDMSDVSGFDVGVFSGGAKVKALFLADDVTNYSGLNKISELKVLHGSEKAKCDLSDSSPVGLKNFCKGLTVGADVVLPAEGVDAKYKKSLPGEYEFVYLQGARKDGFLGKGGKGVVYLVRGKSDRKLYAAKFTHSGKGVDSEESEELYKLWQKSFTNPVEVKFFDDVVIKTFINGRELAHLISDLSLFKSDSKAKGLRERYKNFYESMWKKLFYIDDSNPRNLMVSKDNGSLAVVDAKGVVYVKSYEEAQRKGLNEILRWIVHEWFDGAAQDEDLRVYSKYKMLEFLKSWQILLMSEVCGGEVLL